jgi:hypothetical protein
VLMTFRRFGLHLPDLLRRVWRSVLGTAVMTALLAWSGLGWTSGSGDAATAARELAVAAVAGATIYAATVFLAWLACGRPAGAEADLATVARSGARQVVRRLNAAWA